MMSLDRAASIRNRDAGMEAALEHADAVEEDWGDQALELVRRYPSDQAFMTEEVRAWAYERGLPEPPNHRAWGPVMKKAERAGIITHAGTGLVSNPQAHRTPAALWVKARV